MIHFKRSSELKLEKALGKSPTLIDCITVAYASFFVVLSTQKKTKQKRQLKEDTSRRMERNKNI